MHEHNKNTSCSCHSDCCSCATEIKNEETCSCRDDNCHDGDECGCGCSHEHSEKEQKTVLLRIIISAVLLAIVMLLPFDGLLKTVLFLIPYLIAGYDVLREALEGIFKGNVFDENFLMAVATIGAFLCGETAEGVFVLIFYQTGELFQSYAVGKSRKNIESLMEIRPDVAFVEKDGQLISVPCESVEIGTEITVIPGQRIPLDGVVVSGNSQLDLSALTGESIPKETAIGDEVYSGGVNISGVLKIKTTKDFSQSTAAKILELIENASEKKAKSEKFITRFSKVYTPAVCVSAVALAIIPPFVSFLVSGEADFREWIMRALSFLVISCPCALVMSIPMSFFGGIGAASKNGILIKSSDCLERMGKAKTVVFDKTGTLTKGKFEVTEIETAGIDEAELLKYAAYCEAHSNHPLATGIKRKYGQETDLALISEAKEIPGHGTVVSAFGKRIFAGNRRLMESLGITLQQKEKTGSTVYIAVDGEYKGSISLADTLKETTVDGISQLKESGVKTVMLTGDSSAVAEKIGEEVGISEIHSELLPADKLTILERIIGEKEKDTFVAFVGDGINDAPALARSDVGIAMGSLGSDAAIEGADVVLMDDDLQKIPLSMKISKKTMRIVKQNIVFSIAVKLICLLLSALGIANMWLAIFADVGVMVLAVINAMRAMKTK